MGVYIHAVMWEERERGHQLNEHNYMNPPESCTDTYIRSTDVRSSSTDLFVQCMFYAS